MHRTACSLALAAALLAGCGMVKLRQSVPVALEVASSPPVRDLPPVALLHVRRPLTMNILIPNRVAYEGDLMVYSDLIVFDPRARPPVVPALGDWERVTLYVPGARASDLDGRDVRAAQRRGVLAVAWPAPAGTTDELLTFYAVDAIDSGSPGRETPFLLRRRDGSLYVMAAPGWTAWYPGGDLPNHLQLVPGRWDAPRRDAPCTQPVKWAGEGNCELVVTRQDSTSRKEVAYLFAARADEASGTVAWLYGRRFIGREDPPSHVVDSLTRVLDATPVGAGRSR